MIKIKSLLQIAASYAGLKEFVPAYLDTTLNVAELMTGVSFASAGSGYDPLTPRLSVTNPLSPLLFCV